MSDDPTREYPKDGSFEVRVLAELADIRGRLTTLEEKVDSRLSETRSIWEAVQLAIRRLDSKFDIVLSELYDVRANSNILDKRLMELEAR